MSDAEDSVRAAGLNADDAGDGLEGAFNAGAEPSREARIRAIRESIGHMVEPGQVVELRALDVPNGKYRPFTAYGYFDDLDALAREAVKLCELGAKGVYFTPNPVSRALLARATNRVRRAERGGTTKDGEVTHRRWLLIDVDAARPSGISATDDEKGASRTTANAIEAYLSTQGWPAPVRADSGNGSHLLYRIDLPSEDGGLVKRCLEALASHFESGGAKVDTTVHNPARIWRLYGTKARKGDDTAERPHRYSRVLKAPEVIAVVDRALLEALATSAPSSEGPTVRRTRRRTNGGASADRVVDQIRASGLEVLGPEPWEGGRKWIFPVCPWNAEHTDRSAYIIEQENGALGAGCHHDGCQGKGWSQLRARFAPRLGEESGGGQVFISTKEEEVNDAAIAALARDSLERGDLFQRGRQLVQIARIEDTEEWRPPCIEAVPLPTLRERLASAAQWVTRNKEGEVVAAHPPRWSVDAIHARGVWEGIRPLAGVAAIPVLLSDGSLGSEPGYHPETGLFVELAPGLCALTAAATAPAEREDAEGALRRLHEVVCDFPFASDADRSAWVAALLTTVGRHAFTGPTPMFVFDANVRGAGKTLLADLVALIATGALAAKSALPKDDAEVRKQITTVALEAPSVYLWDNVRGRVESAALEAALTGDVWKDRILGTNRSVRARIPTVWLLTGNNLELAGDLPRRVIGCRLRSPEERPEDRDNFRHADLEAHVRAHRAGLLADALTVLRAFLLSGAKGNVKLRAFGSFTGWSQVIRGALVWLGEADPLDSRLDRQDAGDPEADALRTLLDRWSPEPIHQEELTAGQVIERAKADTGFGEALVALCRFRGELTPRAVSTGLGRHRERVVAGRRLNSTKNRDGVLVWRWEAVVCGDRGDRGDRENTIPATIPAHLDRMNTGSNGFCGDRGDRFPDLRGREEVGGWEAEAGGLADATVEENGLKELGTGNPVSDPRGPRKQAHPGASGGDEVRGSLRGSFGTVPAVPAVTDEVVVVEL